MLSKIRQALDRFKDALRNKDKKHLDTTLQSTTKDYEALRSRIQKGLEKLKIKHQGLPPEEREQKTKKNMSRAKELLQPLFVKKMYLADELQRKSKMSLGKRIYKSVFSKKKDKETEIDKELQKANKEYKELLGTLSNKAPKGQKYKPTKEDLRLLQPIHNRRQYLASELIKVRNEKKLQKAQGMSDSLREGSKKLEETVAKFKGIEKDVLKSRKETTKKLDSIGQEIKDKVKQFAEQTGKPSKGYKPTKSQMESLKPLLAKRIQYKQEIAKKENYLKNAVLRNRMAFDKQAKQMNSNADTIMQKATQAFKPSDATILKMAARSLSPSATPKAKGASSKKRTR